MPYRRWILMHCVAEVVPQRNLQMHGCEQGKNSTPLRVTVYTLKLNADKFHITIQLN